jgi:dTDP-L-rhamnose 4-epimerase
VKRQVLITGGAGFIGSHLADELLANGYSVRLLDNLSPQVHGTPPSRPNYLNPRAELLIGDVRDREVIWRALAGVDFVFHFAAKVGVGQSMYEMAQYTSVNNLGTAVLLEACVEREIRGLVVASSMSVYGEGLYRTANGLACSAIERTVDQFRAGQWECQSPEGETLHPLPTPETKLPSLASVYALSKFDQERICLMIGQAYRIPTVALRFFNVYGERQALSNPYTGVLAIFAARILNGQPPLIFEDGLQQRDFVDVRDVARACRLALESEKAQFGVFNVGSGQPRSVIQVALRLARMLGKPNLRPQITGKYRVGDIRHCFADISLAQDVLGYRPEVSFEKGLADLVNWLRNQLPHDRVAEARQELEIRGLTV